MILEFIKHVELAQGNSQPTVINYQRYLNHFLRLSKIKRVEKITPKVINDFIFEFKAEGKKNQTINMALTAIRQWLKYEIKINNKNVMSSKLIDNLKFKKEKISLNAKDLIQKINSLDLSSRNNAIIQILLSTGLREDELRRIKAEDINHQNKSLSVLGKGGKLRLVFLTPEALNSISSLNIQSGPLFPITNQTIYRAVRSIGNKLNIKLYPHMLRHIFATNLLENGAPIQTVQHLLGHSSISTTEMYSHISNSALKDSFEKYHHN